jgi:hypothetical protein
LSILNLNDKANQIAVVADLYAATRPASSATQIPPIHSIRRLMRFHRLATASGVRLNFDAPPTCEPGEESSVSPRVSQQFTKRWRVRYIRALIHSQISTPRPFGSHTPHWANKGQETFSSQILVALLMTAVGICKWYNAQGKWIGYKDAWAMCVVKGRRVRQVVGM